MAGQVAVVRGALGDPGVPVRPALCFTGDDWAFFAKPFQLEGVLVAWPNALLKAISRRNDATLLDVAHLAARLAEQLPAAGRG